MLYTRSQIEYNALSNCAKIAFEFKSFSNIGEYSIKICDITINLKATTTLFQTIQFDVVIMRIRYRPRGAISLLSFFRRCKWSWITLCCAFLMIHICTSISELHFDHHDHLLVMHVYRLHTSITSIHFFNNI